MVDACRKGGMVEYAGIEEAAVIMQDGSAVKFKNPKLFGAQQAAAWCLLGATTATRRELLPAELQGGGGGAGAYSGGAGAYGGGGGSRQAAPSNNPSPEQMQQIMSFLMSKGFSQDDLQNPAKQAEISEALQKSGLMGNVPGASSAAAEEDKAPALSTNFEDVADDAD